MKKLFISTLAVAGMLCSCSSDDDFVVNDNANQSDLVAIRLGVGASVTRGTGTVGSVDDGTGSTTLANNHWNSEKINVFMFNKGTLDLAMFNDGVNIPTEVYNNQLFTTPSSLEDPNSVAAVAACGVKYYPPQGNFDFWGYRLDDASTGSPVWEDSLVSVPFTIDGSQDVMVAKAVLTQVQQAETAGWGENVDRYYSAFAARKGIQPNMVFKHLLSRLSFKIVGGNDDVRTNGVKLVSIGVRSKHTGKLVVADTLNYSNANRMVWVEDTTLLELKERRSTAVDAVLESLTAIAPSYEDSTSVLDEGLATQRDTTVYLARETQVGEALLVAPQDKYEIEVKLQQPDRNDPSNILSYTYVFTMANPSGFEMGKSYNVKLTIYGLQEIDVTTSLEPWEDGGSITITPEDEV